MASSGVKVELDVAYEYEEGDLVTAVDGLEHEEEYNDADVMYTDDTPTVYIQNGHYLIPTDGQTIVLQDAQDFEQYIINDEDEMVIDEDIQDSEQQESVQFVDEDTGQPIFYFSHEELSNEHGILIEDNDSNSYSTDGAQLQLLEDSAEATILQNGNTVTKVKLEKHPIQGAVDGAWNKEEIEQQSFVEVDGEGASYGELTEAANATTQRPNYQYAILKDGKLHLQTLDTLHNTENDVGSANENNLHLKQQLEAFQQSISLDDNDCAVDFNRITGRNLITGQTVTLNNYLNKLQKRLNTSGLQSRNNFSCVERITPKPYTMKDDGANHANSIMNKKVKLGKTSNGKKMVGKILQIHRKGEPSETSCNTTHSTEESANVKIFKIKTSGNRSKNHIKRTSRRTAKATHVILFSGTGSDTLQSDDTIVQSNEDDCDEEGEPNCVADSSTKINARADEMCLGIWPSASTNEMLEDDNSEVTEAPNHNEQDQVQLEPQIVIKKHFISRQSFDYNVSKTLAGLMEMDSVQHKLLNKNLVVRLVLKKYNSNTGSYSKTVSYTYGHMELADEGSGKEHRWIFVMDNNADKVTQNEDSPTTDTQVDNANGKSLNESVDECSLSECETSVAIDERAKPHKTDESESSQVKVSFPYSETTWLSIIISIDKNGKKSTRVSFNLQKLDTHCYICDKDFKSSIHLRRHHNIHLRDTPTACDVCEKQFVDHAALQRHKKIHFSDKLYQCSQCDKTFSAAANLRRHITVHDPSLRPLQCSVCKLRFTDESSLRKHLLIHTGIKAFTCDVCSRSFINQGDLNFHRRIHDPVKQFCCEVCGREFSRHSNLIRHAEIHRGVNALYQCDMCGCSYNFVSSLTRHIVQNHVNKQQ